MNTQRILKQATRLAVCLSLLLAAGCTSGLDKWEVQRAIEICKDKGGIHSMNFILTSRVICADSTVKRIDIVGG